MPKILHDLTDEEAARMAEAILKLLGQGDVNAVKITTELNGQELPIGEVWKDGGTLRISVSQQEAS